MNLRAQLAVAAVAFALGAWCARPTPSADASPQSRGTGVPAVPPADSSSSSGASTSAKQALFPSDRRDDRWSALVSCLQEPAYFRRRAELAERLADATSADIAAFIARAEKLPGMFQDNILYSLVSRWFEADATAAAKWVRERHNSSFLPIWAAHDRTAALEALMGRGTGREYEWRYFGLDRIAGATPAEQTAVLLTLAPSAARDSYLRESLSRVAGAEPLAALQHAMQLPDTQENRDFQKHALLYWEVDPANSLPLARTLIGEARAGLNGDTFASFFTRRIAGKDLATARGWVEELPPGLRPSATVAAAREWAKKDPVAALEWTRAQGHDIARNFYTEHRYSIGNVLSQAIASHPARTATWLLAQPRGEQRDAWIETAAIAGLAPLSTEQREKAARTWLRDLHTAMREESRAHVAEKLGAQAVLLR